MILDIEVYPNYNLFAFKKGKKVFTFESFDKFSDKDIKKMLKLLKKNLIITYNGNNYDIPLVNYALVRGATVSQMYQASKTIIEDRIAGWMMYRKFNISKEEQLKINHIDIKEPSPTVMISLKLYMARLGSKKLWDLPYDPHVSLTKKQCKTIKKYCTNDLIGTEELYNAIKPQIKLRETMSKQYNIDLRSKSDAQIAEAVMIKELNIDGVKPPKFATDYVMYYEPPKYLKFKSKKMKDFFKKIKNQQFYLQSNGNVQLPAALVQEVLTIGETTYKIGIGGLHSQEKTIAVSDGYMMNADFSSYYPFIILKNGYYPKHLGKKFLTVYEDIVNTRIKAKKEGNSIVADSLKITINGSFGKFGSKYSKLYSPNLLLQVTLTGQLTLLMLIEKIEELGVRVISANTDGLEMNIIDPKHEKKIRKLIAKFDKVTGYEMEIGKYKALYARDVNNYVAKYDGYVKAKGVYSEASLRKNTQTNICFTAVREFINSNTPIEKTIKNCTDIKQFVSARNVKGGAVYKTKIPDIYPDGWFEQLKTKGKLTKKIQDEKIKLENLYVKDNGVYLGKVARWYYSTNGSSIHYKTNGNTVPLSLGAVPMMDLTDELPSDLNYQWYIDYANQMLIDLGINNYEN